LSNSYPSKDNQQLNHVINISKVVGISKFLKTEVLFKKKMIQNGLTSLLKIDNLVSYLKSEIMSKQDIEKLKLLEESELDKENIVFDNMR